MAYLGKVGGPKISKILKRQGLKGTEFVRIVPWDAETFKGLIAREEESEKEGKVKLVLINQNYLYGKGQIYVAITTHGLQGTTYYCSLSLTPQELKKLGDNYKKSEVDFEPPCPVRDDAWG